MGFNIEKDGPNKWVLDVRVKKDGREIRKRETFHGTKYQAEERFLELKKELKDGPSWLSVTTKVQTFGDALALYRNRKLAIPCKEKGRFDRLMRDLGPVPIRDLADKFEKYLSLIRQFPSPRTKRVLANGSVNKFLIITKAALNLAVRMECLEKNPITNARFPSLKNIPRDKVLTENEIHRFLTVIRQEAPYLEAIVRFALQVPCRRSELVNMRVEDLDLIHNAIRVRNGTTKNNEGCWKPIPPDLVGYFRTLPTECPYLFFREEKGGFLPLGDFKKAWAKCLRLAGNSDFRFHDTRHISAANLVDNGTPERVVMAVAGWRTNMLSTYYHRAGKKSLALVNFASASGHLVDTFGLNREKTDGISSDFGQMSLKRTTPL